MTLTRQAGQHEPFRVHTPTHSLFLSPFLSLASSTLPHTLTHEEKRVLTTYQFGTFTQECDNKEKIKVGKDHEERVASVITADIVSGDWSPWQPAVTGCSLIGWQTPSPGSPCSSISILGVPPHMALYAYFALFYIHTHNYILPIF